jgi:hypothetical protein
VGRAEKSTLEVRCCSIPSLSRRRRSARSAALCRTLLRLCLDAANLSKQFRRHAEQ